MTLNTYNTHFMESKAEAVFSLDASDRQRKSPGGENRKREEHQCTHHEQK
jgi:hypothetical protein